MGFELEQVNPFDKNYRDFWIKIEHLARYLFVYDVLKVRNIKQNILDIACGFGYGLKELSSISESIIGVDNNDQAIMKAKEINQNFDNVEVVKWDLEKELINPVISNKMFDHIISFETLEHLENPQEVINTFYSLIKNEGYLFLSIPNNKFESTDYKGNPKSQFHKKVFSENEIEKILCNSGFKIEKKLGQSALNKFIKKENQLMKNKRITSRLSNLEILSEEEYIRSCAYLFAYPDEYDIENSYSRIYVIRKRRIINV